MEGPSQGAKVGALGWALGRLERAAGGGRAGRQTPARSATGCGDGRGFAPLPPPGRRRPLPHWAATGTGPHAHLARLVCPIERQKRHT